MSIIVPSTAGAHFKCSVVSIHLKTLVDEIQPESLLKDHHELEKLHMESESTGLSH